MALYQKIAGEAVDNDAPRPYEPAVIQRRFISSELSRDERIMCMYARSPISLSLYLLAIPHADARGRLTGDPVDFRDTVAYLLDVTVSEAAQAIADAVYCFLWIPYVEDGKRWLAMVGGKEWERLSRKPAQHSIPTVDAILAIRN